MRSPLQCSDSEADGAVSDDGGGNDGGEVRGVLGAAVSRL